MYSNAEAAQMPATHDSCSTSDLVQGCLACGHNIGARGPLLVSDCDAVVETPSPHWGQPNATLATLACWLRKTQCGGIGGPVCKSLRARARNAAKQAVTLQVMRKGKTELSEFRENVTVAD